MYESVKKVQVVGIRILNLGSETEIHDNSLVAHGYEATSMVRAWTSIWPKDEIRQSIVCPPGGRLEISAAE